MIDIAIQHHPSRADLLPRVTKHLRGARIMTDPEPDGPAYPWRTYRRCLETIAPEASHVLVIQDDAIISRHLVAVLPRVIARWEGTIVSFYCGHYPSPSAIAVRRAAGVGVSYAKLDTRTWIPVVALLWPREQAAGILEWTDGIRQNRQRADDAIVGSYCRHARLQPVVTVPNLVNHWDDVPSLLGSRNHRPFRSSCCWIGGCDARTVDW